MRSGRIRKANGHATVLIGAALALALPAPARACSKAYFIGIRGPRYAHFLGVARDDTVAAGAGSVKYRTEAGHFGRGANRAIYGQRVTVEQLGTRRPGALRALGNSVREAILVPWDYGGDCQPVPWSQTARWILPGTRGFFSAALRDSVDWVDGIPTFDVHTPEENPYPRALERGYTMLPPSEDAHLSAEQLLALYNVLPTFEELERDAEGALAPLRQWRRDHPEEQTRFPVPWILQIVLWEAEKHRVRAIRSPIAGTYRVTISLPDRDSLTFFARTTLRPRSTLDALTDSPGRAEKAVGYYLAAQITSTLKQLPRETADYRDASYGFHGSVAVVENPMVHTRDSTVWQGSFDVIGAAMNLAPPGAFRDGLASADSILWRLIRIHRRTYASGYFVRRSNGSMRYTMTEHYVGDPVLTVRAERVSVEYLSDPPRALVLPAIP